MSKQKRIPKPIHNFITQFKKYGKTYTVNVKIFKNNRILNTYYNSQVSPSYKDPYGVFAAAFFDTPTKENKNRIGEIVFSLDHLHPSLISHEAIHIVFTYFEEVHGLNFRKRRKEETFCEVQEAILNGVYDYIQKNNIPFDLIPKWYSAIK